jgi:outer membrane protein insertion porin family
MGSTDEIPITQRFYLGGRTSVRGFRENSLGPRGANGSVIGGNALVASKLEIQHRTLDSLSTHIFFDAGNVFLRGYDVNSYSLRKSIGAGFQYLSPIGPIGFDIGHPLDERSGEPSVRVHFSVGSMF